MAPRRTAAVQRHSHTQPERALEDDVNQLIQESTTAGEDSTTPAAPERPPAAATHEPTPSDRNTNTHRDRSSSERQSTDSLDSDPEIRDIQEKIIQEQKRRKLIILRAKHRKLIQQNDNNEAVLEQSATPEFQRAPRDSTASLEIESQSRKRTRTDTLTMQPIRPPRPNFDQTYEGKSISEYDVFIGRMESHFIQCAAYYNTAPELKVVSATDKISNNLFRLWLAHARNLSGENTTWEEFKDFLMRLLRDPQNLQRDADQQYHAAQQKEYQTVQEFAAYLHQWEPRLSQPYNKEH